MSEAQQKAVKEQAEQKEKQAKAAAEQQAKAAAEKKATEEAEAKANEEADKQASSALENIFAGHAMNDFIKAAGADAAKLGIKAQKAGVAAIKSYTGSYYHAINGALRSDKLDPDQFEFVKAANLALASMPKFKGETKRGTSLEPHHLAQYEPGKIIREKGFMSTSPSKPWSGNARFFINGRSGVDVKSVSKHASENEVLFPAWTWFKVTKKENQGHETHIHLEEV